MVHKKTNSKRKSLVLKYGIQKKAKDHRRKLRKIALAMPKTRGPRKDPGIPNLWPYKEQLLSQIQRDQEKEAEHKQRVKDERRRMIDKARQTAATAHLQEISEQKQYYPKEMAVKENETVKRHWYFQEMNKVIDAADVILEVLDARDPLGCRCISAERRINAAVNDDGSKAKKIVLVLNKIDMIPAEIAEQWVKYFRREYACVAFKSSTQHQKSGMSHIKGDYKDNGNVQGCIGASQLLGLLKNYSRSLQKKKLINVGLIGFPNVGKSSIINSLKRQRSVQVGSTPGITKAIQRVKLDSSIALLDSPGVIMSEGGGDNASLILQNCVRVEQMEDPTTAVTAILHKCDPVKLMKIYNVPEYNSVEEFLAMIAEKHGKIQKKGILNLDAAAKMVLQDWNSGKIPFFAMPPQVNDVLESTVVDGEMSAAFDVEALDAGNSETLAQLSSRESGDRQFMELESSSVNNTSMGDEEPLDGFAKPFSSSSTSSTSSMAPQPQGDVVMYDFARDYK